MTVARTEHGRSRGRVRVLTWHVHGSYLYYLAHAPHDFFIPVKAGRPEGYGGRSPGFAWPDNLHEIPADDVRDADFDCVLFQSHRNYLVDQHEVLSDRQRRLPRIFLEHDPPRQHPTDTRHPVDDPSVLLVHVTHFNDLMWDRGRTPTRVIEHGVTVPAGVRYSGELERGIAVVNGLPSRGRRLGADVFERVRREVAVDLAGIASVGVGGVGDVPHAELAAFESRYRFFFNPIRYTSLGLSVCEAMMLGMPVAGLATTEMVTVVGDGVAGFLHTDVRKLIGGMRRLLADQELAHRLGEGARLVARERFAIERFVADWDAALTHVASVPAEQRPSSARR